MKKLILYILLLMITTYGFSQKQKFQINGAARGYMFANELDVSKELDTVTVRKANYGHTLLDLGVSVFPNDKTEIIGMFRLRNELGGFWGGGTTLNVRQLTLKGVAGDIVKYELGDVDVKMTPYTLFNTMEEGVVNEADAFALRREIVHYDMFYNKNNSWRMQGAKAQFAVEMDKIIKEIDFKAFITRQRATDGLISPERLYGGGTITIHQSKNLSLGVNSISLFDLTETTQDSLQFTNNINTFNWRYTYDLNDNIAMGLKGEAGISTVEYRNYDDVFAPEKLEDSFLDVAITGNLKKLKTELSLGFKDVGPDFFSAGAQTKRIDYSKSPSLYQQFTNDFIGRPVNQFDVINMNTENSYKISEVLMTYNAAYNNSNPYGVATPNRRGVYLKATREDTNKFTNAFVEVAMLNEIRGSGTKKTKSFVVARIGADVQINDFLGWEKMLKLDLGLGYESTNRTGEVYEQVDLGSTLVDLGLTVEFLDKFDLLLGMKVWAVSGNEYLTERNAYNTVIDFYPIEYNFTENVLAGGLRYRFNKEATLSAQYQSYKINNGNENGVDYGISQFNILYNMFF